MQHLDRKDSKANGAKKKKDHKTYIPKELLFANIKKKKTRTKQEIKREVCLV